MRNGRKINGGQRIPIFCLPIFYSRLLGEFVHWGNNILGKFSRFPPPVMSIDRVHASRVTWHDDRVINDNTLISILSFSLGMAGAVRWKLSVGTASPIGCCGVVHNLTFHNRTVENFWNSFTIYICQLLFVLIQESGTVEVNLVIVSRRNLNAITVVNATYRWCPSSRWSHSPNCFIGLPSSSSLRNVTKCSFTIWISLTVRNWQSLMCGVDLNRRSVGFFSLEVRGLQV